MERTNEIQVGKTVRTSEIEKFEIHNYLSRNGVYRGNTN